MNVTVDVSTPASFIWAMMPAWKLLLRPPRPALSLEVGNPLDRPTRQRHQLLFAGRMVGVGDDLDRQAFDDGLRSGANADGSEVIRPCHDVGDDVCELHCLGDLEADPGLLEVACVLANPRRRGSGDRNGAEHDRVGGTGA